MTNQQLKVLAELVLVNDERLTVLSDLLMQVINDLENSLPEHYYAGVLIHSREQLDALSEASKDSREKLRKFFDLG